ncbi:ABC transporter permease [Methylobacterium gnaphalii]|uniref:ABC transporter permease n=1 Tax=Methylobacterium gnaphalii TaxID=1010610 RepID=A0A512JMJ5_9HYPH|nr:ABC transporter permease [Methylobacterium gnaphalii]GEP11148.1 ABC transporter permease [Methylobacterium gnaphalii]GJD71153.1 putative riboflavin import permease protein RfuD [Methylobacterium gnaphalii]GLS49653.1 ABC transporter permease [Methylobacterium gnaphalii]
MTLDILQMVLVTVLAAATPLILAGIGELLVERSGVLNLGVEGMMIFGAAVGFAVAMQTGSTLLGALGGAGAGLLLSALFGILTVGLAANQVASGLSLTILGLGLSGLVGASYVGMKRDPAPHLSIPGLTDLPGIGKLLFGQDAFVYLAVGLVAAVWWFLWRTRTGLILRAIGDDHVATHALGLQVRKVRFLSVLFGGACAGLGGAYLSLAYTPFWAPGMTAGRGWIALALVVFASWKPVRVAAGALLFGGATVLQLHAQAAGLGLPGQLLSAVPYLATILALVLLSLGQRHGGSLAPAALGRVFTPSR